MTALREIAGHLPDRRVPIEELLADWQLPASTVDTLRRSYGYSCLPWPHTGTRCAMCCTRAPCRSHNPTR
jgi:hypothetical protein